ncbi:toxin-antitoxin system YwqK family antitoxin [Actinospica robiniae]|uniref:toxin-antitoxin system YwqK family antitoxin n=1 Tax=Actinospica robiniae TaxID=304901 RepID=UPI00041ECD26|nr:hypothetical protein [Actinospica robiniae]
MPQRIDIDGPDVDLTPSGLLLYRGELFTGEAVEYFEDGSLWTLETYTEGYKNGPTMQWFRDGTLEEQGQTRASIPVGEWTTWHANGRLRQRTVFSGDGFVLNKLSEQQWDEEGNRISDE